MAQANLDTAAEIVAWANRQENASIAIGKMARYLASMNGPEHDEEDHEGGTICGLLMSLDAM